MDNPITIPVLLDLTQAASVTSYGIFSLSRFEGSSITDTLLEAAAELFSNHYGIWGQGAASKVGPFAKAGWRVKISAARLRAEYLPQSENAQNVYVKAMMGETLVGHAFATRWEYEGRTVCWITQLVVATPHRSKGNATQLLFKVRNSGYLDLGCGILSSHPFAIKAATRAFGVGLTKADLSMTREHARSIMSCCPVGYIREAKCKGSLFEDGQTNSGVVSCANTGFYVDHTEPLEALEIIKREGISWPLGTLPDGCEFLIFVKIGSSIISPPRSATVMETRNCQIDKVLSSNA